jgi:hypothetical protein
LAGWPAGLETLAERTREYAEAARLREHPARSMAPTPSLALANAAVLARHAERTEDEAALRR